MRPIFLLACFGAIWSCASATAQPPQARQSALRDSGVINRATPPTTLSGHAPGNAPETDSTPAAFSDRAWTGTQPVATDPATANPTAPVFPAHYALTDERTASQSRMDQRTVAPASGGVRPASHQAPANSAPANSAPANSAPAHEPRPLKPPTAVDTKDNAKGSTGTVQMFVSVMSSLAIVIGLILAAAWCYRKAAPTISGALPKQVVQVLGRTPLAPRQQLVLLRLGSKLVLVSNLHGEVRTISEITDPLEVDRLSGLCEAAQPGSISESFRSVLHNIGRNG